jgi:ABC-type lipoprotein release transport system permease subunit
MLPDRSLKEATMFFTYIARELRRRRRQTAVVAVGLALGIGLVVTSSAMAAGVRTAQSAVLQSLYGVGTDITVTEAAEPGTGGGARFGLNPGEDEEQGERFSRDRILPSPGLGTISEHEVETLSQLDGVERASGRLSLISIHLEGEFAAARDPGAVFEAPTDAPSVAPVDVESYSIEGVDVAGPGVGAITPSQITRGRYFSTSQENGKVAVVDEAYASQNELEVGSRITIDGVKYTVIGIATSPTGGESSNIYIPLARAQKLAGLEGEVNRIHVRATSAADIPAVKAKVQAALPDAAVTTADDLAAQVTGSLSSASTLAGSLGTWLQVAALVAAFGVASLLTLSAVGRRTRELGTLKALGWRSRRVVAQVMGEAVVQGILGGILGIALAVGGAFLVSELAPSLTASVGTAGAGPLRGPFREIQSAASQTVTVPLTAPLNASLLALAIGLALAGGILAGTLGGWRAARLRPAEALRRVE